jgi:hypothetical protein
MAASRLPLSPAEPGFLSRGACAGQAQSRGASRGEAGFAVDEAIDILIAPICYRILFSNGDASPEYVNGLLARFECLSSAAAARLADL